MALTKVLARDWSVEIETATPSTWVEVGGLTTLGFDQDKTDADTGDFQSGGWAGHMPVERGWSVSCEGHYLVDPTPTPNTRDPGQARAEELSALVGPAAMARVRITDPYLDTYVGVASYQARPTVGGKNDIAGWTCDISGDDALATTYV
jgi:hypothetical protein